MYLCSWLFITVVASLLCRGHAASREVFPCRPQTVKFNVSLYYSDTLVVLANSSYCGFTFQPFSAFRIHTRLEEDGYTTTLENGSAKPVFFAARRANDDGIFSWKVPLDLELNGTDVPEHELSVSHTLCPVELNNQSQPLVSGSGDNTSPLPLFYIDVFTYSSKPLFYSVLIEPVEDFVIGASKKIHTTIIPSAPQVFYFKFPSDYNAVTVSVTSNKSEAIGCAYISVQNNSCPLNDLLDGSTKKGMYQSMTEKALITVETKWVQNREFLLVLVAANYSVCHDPQNFNETDIADFLAYGQEVQMEIEKMKMIDSYTFAVLFPIIISFGIMLISCVAVFSGITIWCVPCCVPVACKKTKGCSLCYHIGQCKCICVRSNAVGGDIGDESRYSPCGPIVCVCGKAKEQEDGEMDIPCGDDDESDSENEEGSGSAKETTALLGRKEGGDIQGRKESKNSAQSQKQHLEYTWSAIVAGIFYALPATQLLIFHQRLLHWSGDQDNCYYNFWCTRPAFQLSAFNNVWSNMCFILLGFGFCAIVGIRHIICYCKKRSNKETREYMDTHGIHQHFGLYYAIGVGLSLEGGMGCLYHICPNNANFQFDTAFMYIIAGLIIVKLTHMRHSSVAVSVFAVFISLGVVIFFVVIGIYNDRHHSKDVQLIFGLLFGFFVLPAVALLFFTLKAYKINPKLRKYSSEFAKRICCKWYTLRLAIIIVLNVIVCIIFLVVYKGIASTVLTMIVMNAILLLIFYAITKLLHGEPLTFLAMFLPIAIAISCGFAFRYYGSVTEWSIPPAESRAKNDNCVLLDFYDAHDVWHMSFACTMFFILLFILVMDDGVADVERKRLKNF